MFCPSCCKEVGETDAFCRFCARSLSPDRPASTESAQKPSAAIGPEAKPEEPLRRSGEATASLILGLFSFIPMVGLLAVIFGHLARASIRRSGGRLLGEGMAAWGLFLGYLSLGVWLIYGLSILVHPLLPSTRRAENEKFAVLSLTTLNTAATTYAVTYNKGYPPSLAALGPPKTENPNASVDEIVKAESAQAAGFIDEVLASGKNWAYRFTYTAGKLDKEGRLNEYTVHADPITPGVTTEKHFFTDQSEVIRVEMGKEATRDSPPIM
jgi:hypothetical protein